MGSKLMKVSEVAAELSCGRSTIYELVNNGELNPVYLGRSVRIPADEVASFVAKLRQDGGEDDAEA